MAQAKEMTSGASFPLILNFTLPLLLGNLLQQTYSLMDAAIVGKYLGINALASVGASTSVVFLILGFCTGCCSGFSIPVAQKFGARDYVTMRRFISVSLKISGVMSVALAIITSLLCAFILRTMQTPENIFDGAYIYLLITFIGIPCTFYYNLLSGIIRALGDSKTPFWFLLLSAVLNIILDLFCIIVLGWGVAGAAGKPVRIWQGIKSSYVMMMVYVAAINIVIWCFAEKFALLFIDPSETEVIKDTALFLHINLSFFPLLGSLIILRYTIQGAGYTKLAMFSGVSEMVARIMVSLVVVPLFGYLGVCYGDPTAWLFANLFLTPAFIYVYRRLKLIARPEVA